MGTSYTGPGYWALSVLSYNLLDPATRKTSTSNEKWTAPLDFNMTYHEKGKNDLSCMYDFVLGKLLICQFILYWKRINIGEANRLKQQTKIKMRYFFFSIFICNLMIAYYILIICLNKRD